VKRPRRYADTGELHRDFHRATDASIRWALETCGRGFLEELFKRTAQDVYADIYRGLRAGDAAELIAHWTWFLEREGGRYSLSEDDGVVRLHVRECPAARHLRETGRVVPASFHLQTILMNAAWSEGTPFDITTDVRGECECVVTLRRRADAAE
jgi:hypothetical protein